MRSCCQTSTRPSSYGSCKYQVSSSSCGKIYYDVKCNTSTSGTYGYWTQKETSRNCNLAKPSSSSVGTCGEGYTNPTGKVYQGYYCFGSRTSGDYWTSDGYDTSACGCYEPNKKYAAVLYRTGGCTYGYLTGGTYSCEGHTWKYIGGTPTCVSSMGAACKAVGGGMAACTSDGCYCAQSAEPWMDW